MLEWVDGFHKEQIQVTHVELDHSENHVRWYIIGLTGLLSDWSLQNKRQCVRIVKTSRLPGNGYALGFHPDARYCEAFQSLNGANLAFVKKHLPFLGGIHCMVIFLFL